MASHRSTSYQPVAAPMYRQRANSKATGLAELLTVLATVGLAGVILLMVFQLVA
jgi:hypothetical protein